MEYSSQFSDSDAHNECFDEEDEQLEEDERALREAYGDTSHSDFVPNSQDEDSSDHEIENGTAKRKSTSNRKKKQLPKRRKVSNNQDDNSEDTTIVVMLKLTGDEIGDIEILF